jgi:formylglycine-generating enzyme required for sulfatase activity
VFLRSQQMMNRTMVRGLLAAAVLACAVSAQADVFNLGGTQNPTTGTWTGLASLSFVPVGNPGNVADTVVMDDGTTGYGSVPYTFNMGSYDVTVGQYVAFLNAVATKSDPYGLYYLGLAPGVGMPTIGIVQSGGPGSYSYTVGGSYSQAANCPIYGVPWGDAARFCNWLDNGQPTSGTESTGTTETGAYALNGATTNAQLMLVPSPAHSGSNAAAYFLPTENEWYKAAYYSGGGTNSAYYIYPTKSNLAPNNSLALASTSTNDANYSIVYGGYTDTTNYLTPVGSFVLSPGPYGTYDMGGDVFQWNESVRGNGGYRGFRGGAWYFNSPELAADFNGGQFTPASDNPGGAFAVGFRVASSVAVPEPATITLLGSALLGLGVVYLRRRRAKA